MASTYPQRPPTPRVAIVSPTLAAANNGNWHTAARWQRFLAPLARVEVRKDWHDEADGRVLIALHARRSADSIARFRRCFPRGPTALVLTGTDLYRDLAEADADAEALHSVECASRIVVLQACALDRLDAVTRRKTRVIVQSAPALRLQPRQAADADFVAVGHLREEKDPATLLRAVRLLAMADDAVASAATTLHLGGPLDERLAAAARETMTVVPTYRWQGAASHAAARRAIAQARALVHMSHMEGGANVVIEAVRSRVPVLASRIDGNVGLLGADYDGYFAVGDATALAALMRRFLSDEAFARRLTAQCALREPLFRPAAERSAVRALLADLLADLESHPVPTSARRR